MVRARFTAHNGDDTLSQRGLCVQCTVTTARNAVTATFADVHQVPDTAEGLRLSHSAHDKTDTHRLSDLAKALQSRAEVGSRFPAADFVAFPPTTWPQIFPW